MVQKHGRTGLGGPDDFELSVGSADDGEKWAGDKVLAVMKMHATIDAVVIVSRWYGGTLLGPARFSHIETCASEVCKQFRRAEELRECISTLKTLDTLLDVLRSEYKDHTSADASLQGKDQPGPDKATRSSTPRDYSNLDLQKGRRLIKARENAVRSVKLLLAKARTGDGES